MKTTILVTGGTGALGRAVVDRFARGGATVHVPWRSAREAAELQSLLGPATSNVVMHEADVTSAEGVTRLFQAVGGPVGVLANLVGGFAYAPLEETDRALWDRMMTLNATSALLCCRAAVPGMKGARWGRIVNVSSAPALNHGAANMVAYTAAKAAVLALTESLSRELVGWGITVNALVPTVIDTPANREADRGADTSRWLQPAEIAGVVEFLCGESAGIVTGTAVNLSRG